MYVPNIQTPMPEEAPKLGVSSFFELVFCPRNMITMDTNTEEEHHQG